MDMLEKKVKNNFVKMFKIIFKAILFICNDIMIFDF